MTYRIPLPTGGHRETLDIVEPNSTAVQRFLRRDGLAKYEPPTVATLLTLMEGHVDGFTFFDIGANMGLYALLAAAMFDDATVEAFEPTPSTAAVMRRVVKANQLPIDVHEVAAGDRSGVATLHYSNKSDASNSLVAGFKESATSVDVATVRLDDHVARTGRRPDIMKIDVETFEPAVLAGAHDMIAEARPFIVIEVLNRRGHDHGEEITESMREHGYIYYELTGSPSWSPADAVRGRAGGAENDWLLAPEPLADDFGDRWAEWRTRLDGCTAERNSRVPMMLSVKAALRRGGISEVYATGRRYLRSRSRERSRTSS